MSFLLRNPLFSHLLAHAEVKHLAGFSKPEIIQFFDESLAQEAPHRAKLSIHAISQTTHALMPDRVIDPSLGIRVESMATFKNGSSLLRLPEPSNLGPPLIV